MKLLFFEGVWTNEITRALSWTLLHSLWQGLALAVLAAIVILATKKSKAIVRYNLFTSIFFLFILSASITFISQLNRTTGKTIVAQKIGQIESTTDTNAVLVDATPQKTFSQNIIERLVKYCNEQAPLIVALWFFVFIVKMVRILSGFGYIQKIRYRKNRIADPFWRNRIVELKQRLMITKEVLLLQSELIKIPVVIGFFKPAILVPLGLLSQLPPDQVEAVLLHELAHIRRKDYLVNLIQSFAETVFFFNPALLWISELVREERENCCDDIAIGEVDNKNEFIHALVAFQEYNYNHNTNARLAFAGTKNHLLNRIKRIVYNENKKLNAMEKSIFILSIVGASLVATMSFKQLPAQQVRKSETRTEEKITGQTKEIEEIRDTIPTEKFSKMSSQLDENGKMRIDATAKGGKVYRLEKQNGKTTAFYVDGKKIPEDKWDDYDDVIDDIEYTHEARIKASTENIAASRRKNVEQQKLVEEKLRQIENSREDQRRQLKELEEVRRNLTEEKLRQIENSREDQRRQLKELEEVRQKLRDEKIREIEKGRDDQMRRLKEIERTRRSLTEEQLKEIEKDNQKNIEKRQKQEKELKEIKEESIKKLKEQEIENEKKIKDIKDDYITGYNSKLKKIEQNRQYQMKALSLLQNRNLKLHQDMADKLYRGSIDDSRKFQGRSQKVYLDNLKRYELNQRDQLRRIQDLKISEQKLLNERNATLQQRRNSDRLFQSELNKQQRLLRNEKLRSSLDPIISDLKEDKLLGDTDSFSFELDNDKLIVNGKKQPSEVHARYKERYIKDPKNQYKYSQKGNTKSSTVIEN